MILILDILVALVAGVISVIAILKGHMIWGVSFGVGALLIVYTIIDILRSK